MGFFDPFGRNTSGNGSGGSNVSIDTTLTQSGKAADAKVTGDKIKKIETDGVATINEVKVVGELDSVDDLKIAGKVFESENLEITGEIFNDYENNIANGSYGHAEGFTTHASGLGSHAEGYYTTASSDYQHVQGKYNVEDSTNKYAFIIGNGTSNSNRSNAFAIDWNGNIYVNNSSTGVNLNTVVSDIADRYTKSQTYTKTETDNAIKTKIAEVIANAPEDFNTLKEIADWIDTHSDSASAMNTAINANTEAIQNLKATSKAKLEYVTLSYPDWSNNETTVYSESIAEDSIITLNPGPSITEEQYSALSAARIIASEQGEGYIKLRALGEVTQYVDIPISILIQGNIIEAETNTITDSVTGEKYRFKISNGVMELEKI